METLFNLFSCSVMLESLRPHGLQHAGLPCPSGISWSLLRLMSIESVMPSNHLILCNPFSSCPQYIPSSGSFPASRLFTSSGQSIVLLLSAPSLPIPSPIPSVMTAELCLFYGVEVGMGEGICHL